MSDVFREDAPAGHTDAQENSPEKPAFLPDQAALRRMLDCIAVFAAFSLLLSLSTMVINSHVVPVYGSDKVSLFYALGLATLAAGFAAFGFTFHLLRERWVRLTLGAILYAAGLLGVLFLTNQVCFLGAALICPFGYGYIGGAVHYHLALELRDSAHKGKLIGVALGLAVVVQFFIQRAPLSNTGYAVLLLALLAWLLFRLADSRGYAFSDQKTADPGTERKLWIMVAIIVPVALIAGIYDGMAAALHAQNAVNLAGWTRLMIGVGAVIAGILFDLNRHTHLYLTILCAALVVTMAILTLSLAQNYLLSHLLFTSGMGFYSGYMLMSFIDAASRSANPPLWAGAGRIAHSLAMMVTTALAGVFSAMHPVALDAVAIALCVVALVIFVFSGQLVLAPAIAPPVPTPSEPLPSQPQKPRELSELLALAQQRYRLTRRELDILNGVCAGQTNAELAANLEISENTVKFHLKNLMKKMSADSRVNVRDMVDQLDEE